MAWTKEDLAVEWLLWVRKLRGMQAKGSDVSGALAGLIGPTAMSDDDMPSYLDQLAEIYGAL